MITISLTTVFERQESFKQVIKSLLPQADKINVYLHGYKEIPQFLKNSKIEYVLDTDLGDRKDLDKFWFMQKIKKGYHIIVDDDLIYPSDFVSKLIKGCRSYQNQAVVGFHGRIIDRLPIASYYVDSVSYPCLGEVKENTTVDVLGTGCLCYHTNLNIQFSIMTKECFMSDIHFSLYCKEKDIPMIVLKHKEGYIKHYPIDMRNTIFATANKNDFIQTNYINCNPQWYNHHDTPFLPDIPIVTIAVANTRLQKEPAVVKLCYDSLKSQSYPNIEILIIENYNKEYTIGKCWNDAVRQAKGEWILFVGDDDYITPDYVNSLVTACLTVDSKIVQISTMLTMFRETPKGHMNENMNLIPTGMWRKSYLLEFPISENKVKYVDTEMMGMVYKNGYASKHLNYHYGYFYRSHANQTSGMKLMSTDNGHKANTNKIS